MSENKLSDLVIQAQQDFLDGKKTPAALAWENLVREKIEHSEDHSDPEDIAALTGIGISTEWTKVPILEDPINHPSHYGGDTTYEVIKVIEAWGLDFHLANVLKYIGRAGKKEDTLTDLKKALWYLERRIHILEGEQ